LPFASIKQQQEKAKVLLLLSFFKRINNAYFEPLDVNAFPEFFKVSLQKVNQLFSDLQLETYNLPEIREKSFRTSQLVKTMEIIDEKVRSGAMEDFWNIFFLFEAYLSIAKGIRRYELQFPVFTGGQLKANNLYHPLIKNAVKNSIEIRSTVHLLTGPNMSGKSTFLRALGLCVYLAHLGLAVPATSCELNFYDVISMLLISTMMCRGVIVIS
jgi:DNA mismatch repair protein MutS